ncbi:M23 family metallopeptidase [Tautonia plasticadhaerens]|uniref:Peptidase family M23 n=1 Tax=Tautonia plasticadhaerens TaxID=2527974 RepID=A0A518H3U7_9BACT|nr:M23 family metallopeptidase [Tautonia plasticadhaerens]QDV35488.1 Peptidase family M23 [Tautonia plasticadhaerens]
MGATRRPRRLEWWHVVALGVLLLQLAMTITPYLRPGPLGAVLWMFRADQLLWWGVALLLGLAALATSLLRRPIRTRWRLIGLGLIVALAVPPTLPLAYPSSHADRPSAVDFRLPLDGPVTVGWGGGTPEVNSHVVAPDQCGAYDLLVTRDGRSHRGDGSRLSDYYCYDMPIRSPADGVVIVASDGDPDMPPGQLGGGSTAFGNHIIMKVADREFLFLAHLKPGSVAVRQADLVQAGQVIGRVGNSGNTSEPHLHLHLQDTFDTHLGEGVPMPFSRYRVVGGGRVDRGIPTGGVRDGQIVEHDGDDPPPDGASP